MKTDLFIFENRKKDTEKQENNERKIIFYSIKSKNLPSKLLKRMKSRENLGIRNSSDYIGMAPILKTSAILQSEAKYNLSAQCAFESCSYPRPSTSTSYDFGKSLRMKSLNPWNNKPKAKKFEDCLMVSKLDQWEKSHASDFCIRNNTQKIPYCQSLYNLNQKKPKLHSLH